MKPFSLLLVLTVFLSGCRKEEDFFNLGKIPGTYRCFVEHYYVQDLAEFPDSFILFENLRCPGESDPFNSDCGTLEASVSVSGDNYLIHWLSPFLVISEYNPDTTYYISLPEVDIQITHYGVSEAGYKNAYFKIPRNNFYDQAYSIHDRPKSFYYDEFDDGDEIYLQIWLERTVMDTLYTWSIIGVKDDN